MIIVQNDLRKTLAPIDILLVITKEIYVTITLLCLHFQKTWATLNP